MYTHLCIYKYMSIHMYLYIEYILKSYANILSVYRLYTACVYTLIISTLYTQSISTLHTYISTCIVEFTHVVWSLYVYRLYIL